LFSFRLVSALQRCISVALTVRKFGLPTSFCGTIFRFSVPVMSIQKEDVYETEDLPEAEQHMQVERIHIDMETALKRFKGRMINADHVGEL
uniref:Uncharacterized protein n=1 Tax=Parascaris equorum TaxID=6256 RepID=A0A914R3C0_PAREQ